MSTHASPIDLSSQEAMDLLHKLLTEFTQVKVVLAYTGATGRNLAMAVVIGTLRSGPGEMFTVISGDEMDTPFITFDPKTATNIRYGDDRLFTAQRAGLPHLEAALSFQYTRQVNVTLFTAQA